MCCDKGDCWGHVRKSQGSFTVGPVAALKGSTTLTGSCMRITMSSPYTPLSRSFKALLLGSLVAFLGAEGKSQGLCSASFCTVVNIACVPLVHVRQTVMASLQKVYAWLRAPRCWLRRASAELLIASMLAVL